MSEEDCEGTLVWVTRQTVHVFTNWRQTVAAYAARGAVPHDVFPAATLLATLVEITSEMLLGSCVFTVYT
jgi:hypothetical protein